MFLFKPLGRMSYISKSPYYDIIIMLSNVFIDWKTTRHIASLIKYCLCKSNGRFKKLIKLTWCNHWELLTCNWKVGCCVSTVEKGCLISFWHCHHFLLSTSVSDVGKSSLLLRFADNSFSGVLKELLFLVLLRMSSLDRKFVITDLIHVFIGRGVKSGKLNTIVFGDPQAATSLQSVWTSKFVP